MSDASPKSVIYIAYARADAARVEPVVTALKARGAQVHFDAASAQGSGSYVQMSQQALQQAQSLVVFISAASARSPWVESEARTFQAQMARGGGRRLIPVRLDDTPLPLAFASYQAIDGASAAPDALAGAILGDSGAAAPAEAMAASPAAPEPVAPVAPAVGSSASRGTVYAAFARADAARVAPIVAALRADGWNVDFDPGSMHGGGDYVRQAQRAISGADGLVVFESAASAR
ncbi:MAG TPA: toll/interleukin-1 receptor domain-containing protein, partial [Ktedonobacterales bacterium]